jgi:hypothetical protein
MSAEKTKQKSAKSTTAGGDPRDDWKSYLYKIVKGSLEGDEKKKHVSGAYLNALQDVLQYKAGQWANGASNATRFTKHLHVADREVRVAILEDAGTARVMAEILTTAVAKAQSTFSTTKAQFKIEKELAAAKKGGSGAKKKLMQTLAAYAGLTLSPSRVRRFAQAKGVGPRGTAILKKRQKTGKDGQAAAASSSTKVPRMSFTIPGAIALTAAIEAFALELIDRSHEHLTERKGGTFAVIDLMRATQHEDIKPFLQQDGVEFLWEDLGPALPYMEQYGMSMDFNEAPTQPRRRAAAAAAAAAAPIEAGAGALLLDMGEEAAPAAAAATEKKKEKKKKGKQPEKADKKTKAAATAANDGDAPAKTKKKAAAAVAGKKKKPAAGAADETPETDAMEGVTTGANED